MKSILLAGALFLAAVTTKSFANDVKVTPVVLQTFQSTFNNAANVKWSVVDRLYKADFNNDGETAVAFFSMQDGSLVATARYITIAELPRTLRSSLKSHTATGTIVEMFEVESNDEINYYATVQQNGKAVVFKSAGAKWSVYKK